MRSYPLVDMAISILDLTVLTSKPLPTDLQKEYCPVHLKKIWASSANLHNFVLNSWLRPVFI
ncbi:MAG: hypothetical protein ABL933_17220 [Methyloglobulus sp.]